MKLKNLKRGRKFTDHENPRLVLMKTRVMKSKGGKPFNCICLTDKKNILQGELLYLEQNADVNTA